MGGASSIGGEDVRPSRDVQSLLIPESHEFIRGSMSILPCSAAKRKGTVHICLVYKIVFCMLDAYASTIKENRMVFFNRETMWVSNIVKGRLRLFICDYDLNPIHISKNVAKTETSS